MEDSSSSLYEYAHLPTNMTTRKDEPIEEEPPNIDIDELKTLALKEVKQQKKIKEYEKERIKSENSETQQISHNMIICTKKFMEFYNSQICDNMVISTIFYISSSLWLNTDQDIDDTQIAIQERTQAESFRILSSLYCQLILSPLSANLRVREERIFYETLIFFLDMCACFAVHIEEPELVYELLGRVFRKGLQDPHARQKSEFLPITEIVRRHWLSQCVPGKTRSEIAHSTLSGTTDLIQAMCQKKGSSKSRSDSTDLWEKSGLPKNCSIPVGEKLIPKDLIIDLSPKQIELQPSTQQQSHVPTQNVSPRVRSNQ